SECTDPLASHNMADYSYGVVVEKYSPGFGVWQLFRSTDSCLTALDEQLCADRLRIGDIVQAKTTGTQMRIRRCWPYPDSVWADGTKLVVRTIVSYSKEFTIDRGSWKDEKTDAGFVPLVSRDLGLVAAPVQWYNREFSDAGELHLFVYVEFCPRQFVNLQTAKHAEFFWTVINNRIALPAIPGTVEHADKFLAPDELRRVPAITIQRLGNHMLAWCYALGDRVAIILDDAKSEIGQWMMVTVIPSTTRDFAVHECSYTVLRHSVAQPLSHPEIRIDKGRITMTLTLTRIESENPKVSARLWHDSWGIAVDYDDSCSEWIRREESSQFRAIVMVSMAGGDDEDERRVVIRAIGPPPTARGRERSAPLPHSSPAFDSLDDLKKALLTKESSNNNNNNEQCADQTTIEEKPMKKKKPTFLHEKRHESAGSNFYDKSGEDKLKGGMGDQKSEKEAQVSPSATEQHATPSWNDIPKKEMKSASKASESGGLNWKNWGKKEDAVEKKDEKIEKKTGTRQYEGGWNDTHGFSAGGMTLQPWACTPRV
ncbi:hypothetical protein PENTCL1PPCAC_15002, partial [Pristionchus entomophagus]